MQIEAFKYLGERAGNTSVTGSKVTAASKLQWMPSSQIEWGSVCFQAFYVHKESCVKLRMILWTPCIYHLTIIDFSPGEGPSYCWPDLVSRIRFSQLPPIQTDSVRLCCILCIYHLTIRFPPGGRTRLLLALSCVYLLLQWAAPCERGRHNQTKLGLMSLMSQQAPPPGPHGQHLHNVITS